MYRAIARMLCGPVKGDKFGRKIEVRTATGPLVEEQQRAELLKRLLEAKKLGQGSVQQVTYD